MPTTSTATIVLLLAVSLTLAAQAGARTPTAAEDGGIKAAPATATADRTERSDAALSPMVADALIDPGASTVRIVRVTKSDKKLSVRGTAATHEDIANYMRWLDAVVSTPWGLGRLVKGRAGASTVRVELRRDSVEWDFPVGVVKLLFTDVTVRAADQRSTGKATFELDFELTMVEP